MTYFISFLEGIITFISPCLLPMIPIYISYFAGGESESLGKVLKNALGFVAGFTAIFISLGALAGSLGSFLKEYETVVHIITGLIVILFGLSYVGLFRLPFFRGTSIRTLSGSPGFLSTFLFGMIFSLGWTPCVGVFLGSALMLASQEGQVLTGILMLLSYSLGLGIPFVASALLTQKLKSTFAFIKRNYRIINILSGSFLILVGLFMMTGMLGRLLALLQ